MSWGLGMFTAMVASASAPPVPAAGVGAPSASRTRTPTLRLERRCWGAGAPVVVGIDEVGRGAWAGPVTVAALVPPPDHLRGVRDSKELTRDEREVVAARARAARRTRVRARSHHPRRQLRLPGTGRARHDRRSRRLDVAFGGGGVV